MADDPERLLQRYGYGDPRWLEPGDLTDSKLHPPAVNEFALPPKAPAEVRNDSTRPDAYVDKNVREFMPPTVFAGSYGLGRTLGTAYGDLRMGDYAGAAHALPEIAMAVAPMPGAKGPKLRPRELDKLGYYSQALEAAKAWPMEKGTPEQALAYLKKAGTKDAEIKATALDKYLAEQDGVVTRQGLEDYLRKNRVELQEGKYGDQAPYSVVLPNGKIVHTTDNLRNAEATSASFKGSRVETGPQDLKGDTKWSEYSLDPSNPTYRETVIHLPSSVETNPRWIELSKQIEANAAEQTALGRAYHASDEVARAASDKRANELFHDMRRLSDERDALERDLASKNFRSGHWDEPNVMAHARTSVQRDLQGRPVYLIDELQSDWGQKIREGGARDEAKIADIRKQFSDHEQVAQSLFNDGYKAYQNASGVDPTSAKAPSPPALAAELRAYARQQTEIGAMTREAGRDLVTMANRISDAENDLRRLRAELRTAEAATPSHPLVNTTDQWTTTAIRRLLQDAAEKDAAGIALTPGALQNERFNLERHFFGADVTPNETGRRVAMRGQRGDSVIFDVDPKGIVTSGQIGVGSPLSDVVGKELAERIMAQEAPRTLTGVDFRSGGEGMRYAYDQMYPKMLEKQLRKLDPEHPGRGQTHLVPSDFDPSGMVDVMGNVDRQSKKYRQWEEYSKDTPYGNPFHYFELTPRVKEEIKKGLPLFSLGALTTADLLRRYYGDEQ